MKNYILIFFISNISVTFSQNIEVDGSITATAIFASEEENPFWFYTNTNAAIATETNFSTTGDLKITYALANAAIKAGAAFYYRDGVSHTFQRRDVYLQFKNSWIKATLGSKKQELVFDGLSATNKNFLWSGNARPLPGLVLEANEPIKISRTFSIDWGIGHYSLNDDRYVKHTRVHYKRLGVHINFNEANAFTSRIQHFAQWAGTSPDFGVLPDDFNAFIDVFFAKKASAVTAAGEVQNALGNHLGSYFFQYDLKTNVGKFAAYHEHPFEDGSGTRFANFPDGVWGINYSPKSGSFLSNVLYEYIDTRNQSGNTTDSGFDNYFSNSIYRNGWTYEDRILGLPFILIYPNTELNMGSSQFISNRTRVHHLGISGKIKKVEWCFKSTLASYLGTYGDPFQPKIKRWFNYGHLRYTSQKIGAFTLFAGADTGNIGKSIIGGGLTYSYLF